MVVLLRRSVLLFVAFFLLVGCGSHPVRHLSSDISMIKVDQSTRKDVQTYLGEPDIKKKTSERLEQWVYYEQERSSLQNLYVIGGLFSGRGYSSIVITLKDDLVIASEYRTSDKKPDILSQ